MTRRQISTTRSAGFAGLALVATLGMLAPASVFADEPVDTVTPADDSVADAPETGEVDGHLVAVGTPPVPPTNDTVAVGLPPVPPINDIVAVGLPPVPPTNDTVAVGLPPVPPTNDTVAVGLPPVPPINDIVAVGLPPVPPTNDIVAVGEPPVPGARVEVPRPAQPAPVNVVSADALRSTADAALDVLDAWF